MPGKRVQYDGGLGGGVRFANVNGGQPILDGEIVEVPAELARELLARPDWVEPRRKSSEEA